MFLPNRKYFNENIDKYFKEHYTFDMDFVIKKLEEKFSVTEIANVHFFEFQKEYSTKNDKHPFSELIFVSKGSLKITSEDWTGTLKKGEMIIHPENTFHSLSCDKKSTPTVIIVGFKCNIKELKYFSNHAVKLSGENIVLLSKIIKEGRNVFLPPYNKPVFDMKKRTYQLYGAEQSLKTSIEQFLISIIREYNFTTQNKESKFSLFSTIEVINYIEQNFLEKITIDELAFLFKTNRTSLCKDFKKTTKLTVLEYISHKKTEYAKEKLVNSNNPIIQIADEMNFQSPGHFTRFFLKNVGITPKQYREKFIKEKL